MPQRRKPDHLRVLHGQTRRHDRKPATANLEDDPNPPAFLPREAKRSWRRVVKLAAPYPRWLSQLDRGGLTAYCMSWHTFVEAAKDVARRGPLIPARSSADKARTDNEEERVMVKNPALQVMRDSQAAMRSWAKELGLTPDARSKVERGPLVHDDDDIFDTARFFS